ncbi:MAG: hypothetical protein K2I53_13330, partial [Lachnospiraceae bacterium]|nr:hypothetical protein [Lachnospiraceae bacterium]
MGVKDYYVTVSELIEKSVVDGVMNSDEFGRKFREVFANIGLEDEMISWYASKREGATSGKRRGAYIFVGEDVCAVGSNLNKLFKFSESIKKTGTCENMYEIIFILQELLPWTKDERELEILAESRRTEIKQLFSLVDQLKRLKIFNENKEQEEKKDRVQKELEVVWKYIEKIDDFRTILLRNSAEKELHNTYLERKKKIEQAVR